MKLNLGCGYKKLDGFVNVDNDIGCNPDLVVDLEKRLPWDDNSIDEIVMTHVLEHLGHDPKTYLSIWKELYRVSKDKGTIEIIVPYHDHQYFHDDPTHCRKVTPNGINLFNQKTNVESIEEGFSQSSLGLQNLIDVEVTSHSYHFTDNFLKSFPNLNNDEKYLTASRFNNTISEVMIQAIFHKPARYKN